MTDEEPRGWDDNEPTDWEMKILEHIITINHELGDVVRDVAWLKNILWRGVVPLIVGIAVLVLGILLKLLVA